MLVAGGLWELWSLFQQPAMDTTSYAHPTISALTDPVLAAQPGRALLLGGWLLLGWYLVRRIMRTRTGRVGMLAAWAWLGLHFFAK